MPHSNKKGAVGDFSMISLFSITVTFPSLDGNYFTLAGQNFAACTKLNIMQTRVTMYNSHYHQQIPKGCSLLTALKRPNVYIRMVGSMHAADIAAVAVVNESPDVAIFREFSLYRAPCGQADHSVPGHKY